MDEDRLTPQLGRLIDAAKAAAGGRGGLPAPAGRAEGWAVLAADGKVYAGTTLAAVLDAAHAGHSEPEAAAFAVVGESSETLVPGGGWRTRAEGAPADLPVAVKYLGRWVLVTLGEIPDA